MKNNKHLKLKKILLAILIVFTTNGIINSTNNTISYAASRTKSQWLSNIKILPTNSSVTEGETFFGVMVVPGNDIRHPDFFGEGACQCGNSGKKSPTYTKNSSTKPNNLKLSKQSKSADGKFKDVIAGGIVKDNIYYPTCEEFTLYMCSTEVKKFSASNMAYIDNPSSDDKTTYAPFKISSDGTTSGGSGESSNTSSTSKSEIDVSGMYKENTNVTSTETITIGGSEADELEYDALAPKKTIHFDNEGSNNAVDNLFTWVKRICNILLGLSIVLGLGSIVYLFISLGIHSGNPHMREKIKSQLIVVCTATVVATSMGGAFNFIVSKIAGN